MQSRLLIFTVTVCSAVNGVVLAATRVVRHEAALVAVAVGVGEAELDEVAAALVGWRSHVLRRPGALRRARATSLVGRRPSTLRRSTFLDGRRPRVFR